MTHTDNRALRLLLDWLTFEHVFAVIIGGLCVLGGALVMLWAVNFKIGEPVEPPMPCDEDQVYVWDNHPTSAHCVWDQDHAGHGDH